MRFGRRVRETPSETVAGLREMALQVTPRKLRVAPSSERPNVWGVLMETGGSHGVVTLVSLADGSTSLYFSNGGGIIGAGEHDSVRIAAEQFLSTAEHEARALLPVDETPLPQEGRVTFYVRTFTGTLGADASEEDLGEGRHALVPLFFAGHEVITAIREASGDS